jgi:hypothetical protein
MAYKIKDVFYVRFFHINDEYVSYLCYIIPITTSGENHDE